MSITTYAELQTAAANWLNRTDLTARIAEFIDLSESQFNRRLRTRSQLTRTQATVSTQFVGLPSDLLEMQNVQINTAPPARLEQVTTSLADDLRQAQGATSGTPRYFTIVGTSLELVPTPDQEYTLELQYYAEIPPLTDSVTQNWLLTSHPDAYLYGTLLAAENFLMSDERVPLWKAQLEQILEEIRIADERSESSGDMPSMRPGTRLDYGQWQ